MQELLSKIHEAVMANPMVIGRKLATIEEAETLIWDGLQDLGILQSEPTTHTLFTNIKHGDLRRALTEERELALGSFRAVFPDASEHQATDTQTGYQDLAKAIKESISNRPVGQWSDTELLKAYSIEAPNSVWSTLADISKGQPVIVFNDDGSVAIPLSLVLMRTARKGMKNNSFFVCGGKSYRVYKVGDFPDEVALTCPITGEVLVNEYSNSISVSWEGVTLECLQFIRVIRDESGEPIGKFAARQLATTAKSGGMDELRTDFPQEAVKFDELATLGQLPPLKVSLNSLAQGRLVSQRQSDPLGKATRY